MKKIQTNHNGTADNKWPSPLLDKACEKLDKIVGPTRLPMPKHFPASLKDFLARIVKAKTPADSMARLRQFLRKEAARDWFWFAPKPIAEDERDAWVISQLEAIKKGDKEGGFFTEGIWSSMGSAYHSWWCDQKSAKTRKSRKKLKPAS
jgi:hypothetical protein